MPFNKQTGIQSFFIKVFNGNPLKMRSSVVPFAVRNAKDEGERESAEKGAKKALNWQMKTKASLR